MPLYMVERNVNGFAALAIAAAHAELASKAFEMTANGRAIHLVRTILVAGTGRCISFFDAGDPVTVWRLLEEVGIPADGAMEVFDLKPSTVLESTASMH